MSKEEVKLSFEEKQAIVKKMQNEMIKKYGKNDIPLQATEVKEIAFYSTGILGMDLALGGGVAVGRLVGISGTYSSCKTTTALTTIATQMKKDPSFMAYYYDAENAFSPQYAESLGIDLSRLVVDTTLVAEDGLTKLRDAIDTGVFGIAVLDSTNALSPSKDSEADVSSTSMALRARILSNFYPVIVGKCAKNNCTLFVIEQIRMAVGVMFGNPEINTVGQSGAFAMSQRIMMRRQTKVTEEEGVAISNDVKCKVIKNKTSNPFRTCTLTCIFGKGFDDVTDIANLSVQLEVCERKGAYIYYPNKESADEKHTWNSMKSFVESLGNDPSLKSEMYEHVMYVYKNSDSKTVMQDSDTTDEENIRKAELAQIAVTSTETE